MGSASGSDVSLVLAHGIEPADLRMFHRLDVPVRAVGEQVETVSPA